MDELSQAVEVLLNITRKEIDNKNRDKALSSLLHAIRLTSGEDSIIEILTKAKDKAYQELQEQNIENKNRLDEALSVSQNLLQQDTIIKENGDEDLLRQTFEDGSSVVCSKCGALVATSRWDSHSSYWCSALPDDEEI